VITYTLVGTFVVSAVVFALVYYPIATQLSMALVSPYAKADVKRRLFAATIDGLLVVASCLLYWNTNFVSYLAAGGAYLLLRDAIRGQSIGKFLLGLVVISLETGSASSLAGSVRRNLLLLLPGANIVAIFLEAGMVVRDPQGQRLGDRLAQTQVVEGFGAKDLVKAFQDWLMGLGTEFGPAVGKRGRAPVRIEKLRASACGLILGLAVGGESGCSEFGYTRRVLWRVPSPAGTVVAVCQEIPEFDGPGYDVRLESPDGSRIAQLYQIGDGDPCSELAWSPDGKVLAVLSGHVARIRFVDVGQVVRGPTVPTQYWSWRQVDLSTEGNLRQAKDLRFVGPVEVELTICPYDLRETQRTHTRICTSEEVRKRFRIPLPIKTGQLRQHREVPLADNRLQPTASRL
jgi:uncharacterized RDD family membrane protein YckC